MMPVLLYFASSTLPYRLALVGLGWAWLSWAGPCVAFRRRGMATASDALGEEGRKEQRDCALLLSAR